MNGSKQRRKRKIPIATGISSWNPYTKIIYKCANCGQDFRFFGEKELFCHHCGVAVDWEPVLKRLPEPFHSDDYDTEKKLIIEINQRNLANCEKKGK